MAMLTCYLSATLFLCPVVYLPLVNRICAHSTGILRILRSCGIDGRSSTDALISQQQSLITPSLLRAHSPTQSLSPNAYPTRCQADSMSIRLECATATTSWNSSMNELLPRSLFSYIFSSRQGGGARGRSLQHAVTIGLGGAQDQYIQTVNSLTV